MLQGPDLNNEYSGCVAVDAIEFENCNLPEARDKCNEDEFHCEQNKVISKNELSQKILKLKGYLFQ